MNPRKRPQISLIIRTYNEERRIGGAIASYLREGFLPNEIVLADCDSQDRTLEIAASYGVRAYVDPVWNSTDRTNRAVEKFGSDCVVILDADMEAMDGFGQELRERFDEGAECLIIPEQSIPADTAFSRARAFERELFSGDSTIEAARGFSKRVWDLCGGFTAPPGVDDWVLGIEAARHTLPIRMKRGVLHHELPLTALMTIRKYSQFGPGWLWLLKRDPRAFLAHGNPIRPGVRRNRRVLLSHPRETAALIAFKSLVYTGGILGLSAALIEDVRKNIFPRKKAILPDSDRRRYASRVFRE